jgi:poly(3-hydroxybutyrate) depolymerase
MRMNWRCPPVLVGFAILLFFASTGRAQETRTLDETIPPGRNFDKAEFRLWIPKDIRQVRAIAVLLTGSNGDARSQVDDPVWQAFAVKHSLALVGCRFTDKPHDRV